MVCYKIGFKISAAAGGVPAWVLLCVILAYIALGATVFATYQGWNFVDGLFFSFAVLGTIGLIDIPPSPSSVPRASTRTSSIKNDIDISDKIRADNIDSYTNDEVKNVHASRNMLSWIPTENKENRDVDSLFVVLCTCYLLIGLAIISMCVQLMEHTCRDILQRLATTRLMGRHGSWMFAVYGDNKRMGKSSGRYWTTSASESPNNSSSWQGLSRQNSCEASVDNLTRQQMEQQNALSRTNVQGIKTIF